MKITQAVILAGGQGVRLRPLTRYVPKPMILIHGRPFLEYIIILLRQNNIREVVLLVGYLHKKIIDYFGDGRRFGLKIRYSYDPVVADTGTRIKNALRLIDKQFLLLYADNYWPLDLRLLIDSYKRLGKPASVVVYANKDYVTKNNMLVNKKGLVQIYDRTRKMNNLNGVDIGFFILDKKLLVNLPNKNFSLEDFLIPRLIKKEQLAGLLTSEKYYGLSNTERIPMINKFFKTKI